MRNTFRFSSLLPLSLVSLLSLVIGCFEQAPETDSGTANATQTESGAETETGSGSGDGDGDGGDGDGDGDAGDGDGDGGDGDGDGDAGDGDGDGDGDAGDGDGDAGDGDGDACMPTTEDPSQIGIDCESNMDCGPGYTCQPFNGFVQDLTCQILCADPCECPDNHSCVAVMDKGNAWMQCEANP